MVTMSTSSPSQSSSGSPTPVLPAFGQEKAHLQAENDLLKLKCERLELKNERLKMKNERLEVEIANLKSRRSHFAGPSFGAFS